MGTACMSSRRSSCWDHSLLCCRNYVDSEVSCNARFPSTRVIYGIVAEKPLGDAFSAKTYGQPTAVSMYTTTKNRVTIQQLLRK